ncbi:D-alanyl-D-alanine carboxypeptidase family protein [Paractinoplanes deccanensis]|uniref:D-alanyl-D-alanine carboxypeptidase family protein n=1 Tax=Paractinoplanes deccanensis TaxID=113561 RepID=UPI0019419DC6|nr:serine hydrolase [Actinoplanes deccanensis]
MRSILAAASAAALLVPAVATPAAAAAPVIPCPKPKVAPPAGVPARPVPPPDDPVGFAIGGDALATHGLIVPAGVRQPPAVTATTWMVADLDTGEVLGGCGPHVYQTPASVQKTLLAATAIDKLDPAQKITVVPSDLDIEPGSSAVGLVAGGTYPISTLWLGLLLNSGNDAANALARLAGGGGKDGVAKTVAAMNDTAKRLGAYQTHAVTPSGLDGKGQFTSAYDLALIARVCFANADFRKYALTRTAQMPAQPKLKKGGFQFQNENKLIYNYPGAMGGKTGFTKLARHSYVGAAERNGRRLVVTLLGAEARPQRGYEQGASLLDWGFSLPEDASVGKLVTPEETAAKNATPQKAPQPSATAQAAASTTRPTSPQLLSVAAAASVALLLAATPLLLLLTQRRRIRRPRKSRQ